MLLLPFLLLGAAYLATITKELFEEEKKTTTSCLSSCRRRQPPSTLFPLLLLGGGTSSDASNNSGSQVSVVFNAAGADLSRVRFGRRGEDDNNNRVPFTTSSPGH